LQIIAWFIFQYLLSNYLPNIHLNKLKTNQINQMATGVTTEWEDIQV